MDPQIYLTTSYWIKVLQVKVYQFLGLLFFILDSIWNKYFQLRIYGEVFPVNWMFH